MLSLTYSSAFHQWCDSRRCITGSIRLAGAVIVSGFCLWAQPLNRPIDETSQTGTISGRFVDAGGKAVARATVKLIRLSPTRWTSPVFRTNPDGTFSIGGAAAGEYVICGEAPRGSRMVNPCIWLGAAGQKTIAIGAGQKSAGHVVTFRPGRVLQVEVKDRDGILREQLPAKAAIARDAVALRVEVQGPPGSITYPLHASRPTPEGVLFETVLPVGETVQLRVHTSGITLSDDAQRALPSDRLSQSVPVPAKGTALQYTLHVSRKAAGK